MKKRPVLHTPLEERNILGLEAGDQVLLSGTIVTARDEAHRRMSRAIEEGQELPIDLTEAIIFYAAPTPTPPGRVIGSIGPTTSGRMDLYTPLLIEKGLRVMIGKGVRSPAVKEAMRRHGAVYFGAPGGVAALLARSIRSARVIAFEDAGPEAMMELEVVDFPLVVINDNRGGDLYEMVLSATQGFSPASRPRSD